MDLDVRIDNGDNGTMVVATGSIDMASRDRLAAVAEEAMAGGSGHLVLDLSGVTFIDSTGIGTLVTLAAEIEERGGQFTLRKPSRPVTRILEVAGLAEQWIGPGAA